MDQPAPPWGSLQADALQTVFEALPATGNRAACRLVCRRWREVADESPGIWGACGLRQRRAAPAAPPPPPSLEAACALLARQRHVLRRLQLDLGAVQAQGSLPAAEALAAAVTAACGAGSGLTDLTLGLGGALPPCVAQALPGSASQLTALTVRPLPGQPPPSLRWRQLTHLSALSSLVLTADLGQQAGPAASLARLGLTRLRLQGAQRRSAGRPARLPEVGPVLLACPTSLQRLELAAVQLLCCGREEVGEEEADDEAADEESSSDNSTDSGSSSDSDDDAGDAEAAALVAGQGGGPEEAAGGAAGAAAGAQHALAHAVDGAQQQPAGQAGGQATAALAAAFVPEAAGSAPVAALQGPAWPHQVGGYMWMPVQGRQPAAGLRERWRGLEALRLHNVDVAREVLAVLPSLPCLTALHLAPRSGSEDAIKEAQRCSNLQEVTLARCDYHLPPLPPGALSQLTRLRISGSDELMKLHPSWCMLPHLQSFELESCEQLVDFPVEVSTLDRLERLSFSHQRMEQLPWMLTGLSQLTRLAVAACSLEALPAGPYLRSLRELVLFANNLSCVPPALAHPEWGPSSLRRLDLSSNYSHHLSSADVAVLRGLTTLEFVDLRRQVYTEGDAHPEDCLAELRAALPGCAVLV